MQPQPSRVFEAKPATRTAVPLLIGLVGPSGSGKTFSALRLAAGIQRVTGGETFVIDTEARRALHYADKFKFQHVEFGAPFGPLDYLAAVEFCRAKGAKTIVIDSASHLHEGPGGVLEMHSRELERLGGSEKVNFLAWKKPKEELRRFINSVLQMSVNLLFCFRAKEKLKIEKGKEPTHLGFMPIASDEFIYEMTCNMLLYPNSNGVPTWQSPELGEKAIIKLPEQFRDMFSARAPLDEATGQRLAEWAAGGTAPGRAAPKSSDGDKRALLKALAALREKIGWSQDEAREWREKHFGEGDPTKMATQQLEDARTLMDLLASGNNEGYGSELDSLVELGRARGEEIAA